MALGVLALLACGAGEPPTQAPPAPVAAASAAQPAAPPVEASPPVAPPMADTIPAPPPAPSPVAPPVASYDGLGAAARIADIQALVDAAAAVVTSAAFHAHLAALTFRATPDLPADLPGEDVFRSLVGFDAASRPRPVSYAPKCAHGSGPLCPVAKCTHQTADTDWGAPTTLLNECTFARAAARPAPHSDDVEAFACAINTIAHEWTHTIPQAGDPAKERFLDRGHKPSTGMLASYTVGAVAQCTYLEAGGHLPETFEKCVDDAGTYILKPATCVKGWAKPHGTRGVH